MRTILLWLVIAVIAPVGSTAPAEAPAAEPCLLNVSVHVGASLTVNGARTEQMTALRRFVSPPLPRGKSYYYTFEATYTSNGVPVARRKVVEVNAGATVAVDMTAAPIADAGHAAPAPKPSPFETPKKKVK
jgi:uncharacterized protein (TIGR03000 family)